MDSLRFRIVLALTTAALMLGIEMPTWGASSIDVTQPVQGVPYSPAPIRQNFQRAANDIAALQGANNGPSPPANPSPGTFWLQTPTNGTVYSLQIWDGRGRAWLPIASLDTVNNIWMPPIGGGIPPTILSAATTDLGTVPQATVYISGNNAIQSFGTSAPIGTVKILVFTGTPTLMQNPSTLILPAGVNITQTAGSTVIAVQLSSGLWQVLSDTEPGSVLPRTFLTTTGNLYVATTGTDTNNNCASALTPCQTIPHACQIAATNYDLGGQILNINVANGTYGAGCSIDGPLVGAAAATPVGIPMVPFPVLSGLQIIGNPSNPSAVVIADTSSPGGIPAVFAASEGAYYAIDGFTVSSVNGDGVLAQSLGIIQFRNMIFGNAGDAQIKPTSKGIVHAGGNYTITGNSQMHVGLFTGGLFHANPITPITVTLSGTPTFSQAFLVEKGGSQAAINSGVVTFNGSTSGPKFLIETSSFLDVFSGSPDFLPGSVNGAVIGLGDVNPPIQITSVASATGLGAGGTAQPGAPGFAQDNIGAIQLLTGSSGTASTGTIILNSPTHMWRVCNPTLGQTGWATGSTVTYVSIDEDHTQFTWFNGGATPVNLTTGASNYYLRYTCFGQIP